MCLELTLLARTQLSCAMESRSPSFARVSCRGRCNHRLRLFSTNMTRDALTLCLLFSAFWRLKESLHFSIRTGSFARIRPFVSLQRQTLSVLATPLACITAPSNSIRADGPLEHCNNAELPARRGGDKDRPVQIAKLRY